MLEIWKKALKGKKYLCIDCEENGKRRVIRIPL